MFLYADHVILLAPSVQALQSLVDLCASELEFRDMAINVGKSACMRFIYSFIHQNVHWQRT